MRLLYVWFVGIAVLSYVGMEVNGAISEPGLSSLLISPISILVITILSIASVLYFSPPLTPSLANPPGLHLASHCIDFIPLSNSFSSAPKPVK